MRRRISPLEGDCTGQHIGEHTGRLRWTEAARGEGEGPRTAQSDDVVASLMLLS
jgi:hypothetical protein